MRRVLVAAAEPQMPRALDIPEKAPTPPADNPAARPGDRRKVSAGLLDRSSCSAPSPRPCASCT